MKKILIVFAVAAACYACGGGTSEGGNAPVSNNESNNNSQIGGASSTDAGTQTPSPTTANTSTPGGDSATNAAATTATGGADGKALIAKSDCLTCHKEDAKVIGPAYKDVAKKYPNTDENVKKLAAKIIAGGSGVWGQIPMTAHPQVSQGDAEAMVKYILSLK